MRTRPAAGTLRLLIISTLGAVTRAGRKQFAAHGTTKGRSFKTWGWSPCVRLARPVLSNPIKRELCARCVLGHAGFSAAMRLVRFEANLCFFYPTPRR